MCHTTNSICIIMRLHKFDSNANKQVSNAWFSYMYIRPHPPHSYNAYAYSRISTLQYRLYKLTLESFPCWAAVAADSLLYTFSMDREGCCRNVSVLSAMHHHIYRELRYVYMFNTNYMRFCYKLRVGIGAIYFWGWSVSCITLFIFIHRLNLVELSARSGDVFNYMLHWS